MTHVHTTEHYGDVIAGQAFRPDGTPQTVGLHGPVYISVKLLEDAKLELIKLGIRAELGDKISALETLGCLLLRSAGKLELT